MLKFCLSGPNLLQITYWCVTSSQAVGMAVLDIIGGYRRAPTSFLVLLPVISGAIVMDFGTGADVCFALAPVVFGVIIGFGFRADRFWYLQGGFGCH